jgi:pyruvate kinase
VECSDTVLPVTYTKFAGMMESGDTLYVGRYLVSGADSASLYLEVRLVAASSCTTTQNQAWGTTGPLSDCFADAF